MYDLVIIGSGPAGYTAAFEAAKHSLKTLLIEKEKSRMGGTCLNEGCIPLKGILHHSIHDHDYARIKTRVMKRVELLREGLRSRLKSLGIEMIEGTACIASANSVECAETTYETKNILIAAGSSPKKIFAGKNVLPSEGIFSLESVPEKTLIIGGGVIGCEYATFLNNIGSMVDIIEVMPSILYGYDDEAVRTLAREFKKRNITLHESCVITNISDSNTVTFEADGNEKTETYDCIIEAAGRTPNTFSLGIERIGIVTDNKGFIPVNEFMQTAVPSIYACGDCISTPMLEYTASNEAEKAVKHICAIKSEKVHYANIPYLVFSQPQIGMIGIRQTDAAAGTGIIVKRYYFKALGKSFIEENDVGFLKLVIDKSNDSIVGAAAVGGEVAEIINELSLIISCGITNKQILSARHIHPSYNEIIGECLKYGI